jgi:hypothetical protein
MEVTRSIILPQPKTDQERNLFQSLGMFITNMHAILNGGISFGDNVDCSLVTFTSSATPDEENTVGHTLGKIPTGYIIYSQDKAGSLYDSGTTFTATNIYTKCDVASVTFKLIIF